MAARAESSPESFPDRELDSSRGWIKRELWTSTELAGWPGWEHLQQVWLVRVWTKPSADGPVELREDDHGWVRRGHGRLNTGLLRAMAYDILAIARSVHLRRPRLISWQQLPDWRRDALVWCGLVDSEPDTAPAPA